MSISLTPRQSELLAFLQGRPGASYREIREGLGWSLSTIHMRMIALQERGAVNWRHSRHRACRILTPAKPTICVIRGEAYQYIPRTN